MELSEKLRQLRTEKQLTQEELAARLFVSRTAVSKWESGRGTPGIDSLKAIADYFHVSVDELLSGDELVSMVQSSAKAQQGRSLCLFCGILDSMCILLLFLPFFGQTAADGIRSVGLIYLLGDSAWIKTAYLVLTFAAAVIGFVSILLANFDLQAWNRRLMRAGIVITVISALLFVLSRQPYAGTFSLVCLIAKGYWLLKSK